MAWQSLPKLWLSNLSNSFFVSSRLLKLKLASQFSLEILPQILWQFFRQRNGLIKKMAKDSVFR